MVRVSVRAHSPASRRRLQVFRGEVAQQGFHFRDVGGIFTKRVIVGNRFGFRIDEEFVGVAPAGFAEERGAPLAEYFSSFSCS